MYFPDDLKAMTVAQLRKYAREQGVELQQHDKAGHHR